MKRNEFCTESYTGLNYEELSSVQGGSFAYDLGLFLRYMGIYFINGTGMSGTAAANADLAVTLMQNE
jgi:hypothetical protein